MGADTAIHVETDMRTDQELQPLAVAKILQKITEKVQPDLIITGKQAIDDDSNMTGQMLAGALDWPQATFISKLDINAETKVATATREIDGGLEVLELSLPALVTTDLRLNEPRYVTLPNIMKARKKPIEAMSVADMGLDVAPRLETVEVNDPPQRTAGEKVEDLDALVATLVGKGL
jgi:electron transfer flavoprotein beta subunit